MLSRRTACYYACHYMKIWLLYYIVLRWLTKRIQLESNSSFRHCASITVPHNPNHAGSSLFSVRHQLPGMYQGLLLISMLLLVYSYASSAPVLHDSMPPFGRLCKRDITTQRVKWTTVDECRGCS